MLSYNRVLEKIVQQQRLLNSFIEHYIQTHSIVCSSPLFNVVVFDVFVYPRIVKRNPHKHTLAAVLIFV